MPPNIRSMSSWGNRAKNTDFMNQPEARFSRAFFFLLDGARIDLFREFLERGDLPNIARYLVEPGRFTAATTVFPSVTGVAYIPWKVRSQTKPPMIVQVDSEAAVCIPWAASRPGARKVA